MRQRVAKIVLLLVFVLASVLNMFLFDNRKAFASATEKVAYPNFSINVFYGYVTTKNNVTWIGYIDNWYQWAEGARINLGSLIGKENVVVTGVKIKLKVDGKSKYRQYDSFGGKIELFGEGGYNYRSYLPNGDPSRDYETELYYSYPNSWGSKFLDIWTATDGHDDFEWDGTITIKEIRYIEYTLDDVELKITPDRKVQVTLKSNQPVKLKYGVKNKETGALFTGIMDGTSATVIDKDVFPERYYTYEVYIGTGTRTLIPGETNVPSPNYQATLVGSYTIQVPSDATLAKEAAEAAQQAAQGAQQAAQQAQQAAQQAASGVNYIQNNILSTSAGVVQDSQGTVLMEARLAKIKADQAATAIGNVQNKVDSIESKLSNMENNISSQLSNMQSQIQNQINETVNNAINSMPPILMKIKGYNGATATKTSSIRLVLEYANANEYRVKLNNGSWSGWQPIPVDKTITVGSLSTPGMYTIHVEIRNKPANYDGTSPLPTASGSYTAFRL